MGIICNGIQRSGTHLLSLCIEVCGYTRYKGLVKQNGYYPKDNDTTRERSLFKFYKNFGSHDCVIGHSHYPLEKGGNKVFFITRDVRSWVVSAARYKERVNGFVPPVPSETALLYVIEEKMGALWDFVDWYDNADMRVRFEDLVKKDNRTFKRICKSLDHPAKKSTMRKVVKMRSNTWTGRLSDWKTSFTEEVQQVFSEEGGNELMSALGYDYEN